MSEDSLTIRTRAKRMSPAERRDSIVDFAMPLLAEKGDSLVVAEVAEAAGVAEATVFKVFPTRDSLIQTCLKSATNTTALERKLRRDRERKYVSLQSELVAISEALRTYFVEALRLYRSIGAPKKQKLEVGTQQLLEPVDKLVADEFAHRFGSSAAEHQRGILEMIFVSMIYGSAIRELAGLETPSSAELISTLIDRGKAVAEMKRKHGRTDEH